MAQRKKEEEEKNSLVAQEGLELLPKRERAGAAIALAAQMMTRGLRLQTNP